ncbi:uncharacterized protein PHALS_02650 [Plasmopara halstedii]|uniref:Uncharacterized protein n=1 Tax=Plasmopara halstedii TaxID=4781 RepID=A0A0P1AY20_PLAHL|nr:uncharacterized protein PHALS_02650 [Plasmopara halstedii]CEG46236.1 hypothetical protein PHALS_02650 [Plasmopara halstedii]|eukprot:XP_024582605.1 hypothetical protein PHALS_02650 [Plasmopara halstedii]
MSDAVKSSLRIVGSIVRLYIFPNGQRLSVVAVSTARFQEVDCVPVLQPKEGICDGFARGYVSTSPF